jgi:hypothetical protein
LVKRGLGIPNDRTVAYGLSLRYWLKIEYRALGALANAQPLVAGTAALRFGLRRGSAADGSSPEKTLKP